MESTTNTCGRSISTVDSCHMLLAAVWLAQSVWHTIPVDGCRPSTCRTAPCSMQPGVLLTTAAAGQPAPPRRPPPERHVHTQIHPHTSTPTHPHININSHTPKHAPGLDGVLGSQGLGRLGLVACNLRPEQLLLQLLPLTRQPRHVSLRRTGWRVWTWDQAQFMRSVNKQVTVTSAATCSTVRGCVYMWCGC